MKWLIPCLLLLIIGCHEGQVMQHRDDYLFKMLSVEESGIDHFYGSLPHATLEGGGVGVGDFNQDGLQDVFLVGDSIHGLYENIGELKFKNRIELSGIPAIRGVGPVVVYDINKDQLPDIILGRRDVTNNPLQKIIHGELDLEKRESNLTILINQGNFNFKEEEEYQIKVEDAIGGISLADFDKNGLLDIALSSWNVDFEMLDGVMLDFERDFKSDSICTVKLFLQFEGGKFIEECTKVGVTSGGRVRTSYSNICTDINSDSRIDLIVTNDFDFPDQWYINQGNSEFKRLEQEIQNMPFFSMGIDVADVNNDGLIDVFITDMRPSGYYRQKTVKYDKSFNWLDSEGKVNLTSQQVRNHFYINQGETQFSEIAEMTGMDATEWSWSVLLADFDNNEHKDVFVGNGYFLQDLMRHDSPLYIDSIIKFIDPEQRSIRIFDDTVTKSYFKNFFYANQGNLDFKDASQEWFMGVALNTRGAAYADLDNDGDLDLIFNNAKQRSCILQNTSIERDSLNFFRVQLISDSFEPLHSKCYIYYNNQIQLNEFNPIRGFYSSSEPILHFGLGKAVAIDSLVVVWTNGLKTTIIEPLINQTIVVSFQEEEATQNIQDERAKKVFVQEDKIINYLHKENVYNDFKQNLLLPQKYSTFGPYFALGDLSGNGLEDLVIGGALNAKAVIYYQLKEEEYRIDSIAFEEDIEFEDAGVIIFDINDDGLNDVFIAAGGNEEAEGNKMYTHRYYINQGNGVFIKHFLEGIQSSASALKLIEINAKQYLIVAGRLRPWAYPLTPRSYVLGYENGQFVDVTESIVPGLSEVGMVTDILCTDFNQDSQEDLIVVGEYMKPVF